MIHTSCFDFLSRVLNKLRLIIDVDEEDYNIMSRSLWVCEKEGSSFVKWLHGYADNSLWKVIEVSKDKESVISLIVKALEEVINSPTWSEDSKQAAQEVLRRIRQGFVKLVQQSSLENIPKEQAESALARSVIIASGSEETLGVIEIGEIHAGTRGASYVFVIKEGEIVHISQLRGARLISKQDEGRSKYLSWGIPIREIAGCEVLRVSYSNSGNYSLHLLRLPDAEELSKNRKLDHLALSNYIATGSDVLHYIKKSRLKFKEFGREHSACINYLNYVPILVKEFWSSMRKLGIINVYTGKGRRLEEALYDPELGYINSMFLPSEQSRVRSLYEKLSKVFELWILSKVAEALSRVGRIADNKDWIWIEHTTNQSVLEFQVGNSKYSLFYQPSIFPHIITGFLPKAEIEELKRGLGVKELHLIPDIVLAKDVEGYINWGKLYRIRGKVKLVIEAKLSLKEVAHYETINAVKYQLEAYRKLLDADVLVVILEPNRRARSELEKEPRVRVVDDAINNANNISEIVKAIVRTSK